MMSNNGISPQRSDGRKHQIAFWAGLPPGMSIEILTLTGFIPQQTWERLKRTGMHDDEILSYVFGGRPYFPLPRDRTSKKQLDKILYMLNRILQIKASSLALMKKIDNQLQEKWGGDNLDDLLPEDYPEEAKKDLRTKTSYPMSGNPSIVRTLLQQRQLAKYYAENPGHYPGIYSAANTLFSRMLGDFTTLSLDNLSLKESQSPVYDLDSSVSKSLDESRDEGRW